ncbi:hypothetical protein ACIRBX_26145 [Kitasatospora sp. NPDC096147]|uniref:hypothetical protein n=1 Tax=Kitasatospora sp. NPDC096147 TaxID=3364093 RepID=UPI00381B2213
MPDHYFAMGAFVRAEAARQSTVHPARPARSAPAAQPAPDAGTTPAPSVTHRTPPPPNATVTVATPSARPLRTAVTGALRALRTVFG